MPGSSGLLLRLRTRSQTVTGRISAALSRIAENTVQSAAILVAATLLAVVWVNSPFGDTYDEFWHLKAGFVLGPYELILDLKHWVNDGLMALFFFTIGLEVKRELAIGELTDRRRAAVPIVAAVAGLLLPALIFLAFNAGTAAAHAWGVVVSTDTAFVLALLALVGPKPGTRLRLFLVTLAVADDIGALTIIAFFYTESLSWGWLGLALLGLAVVGLLRWLRVRRDGAYLAVGILTWIAAYQSGVHATLAGVAIALILPVYPPKREAVERVEEVTRAFRQSPSAEYERLARRQITSSVAINERLQVLLRPFVALVVLPLFALANAGVSLSGESLAAAATSRLTWGVIAGLVVGKLVGVLLGARLAARTPWAELPPGLTHKQLAGGAALAGIGFTISLFIVDLALDDPALQDQARVGVFAASLIAAGLGALSFYLGRADAALSGPPVELLRPVDPDRDHIRGRVDAPLTLVEYADFECPFCSKATGSIAELREWLGDDLRYVFRHLRWSRSTRMPGPLHWPAKPLPRKAGSGSWPTGCSLIRTRSNPTTCASMPPTSGWISSGSTRICGRDGTRSEWTTTRSTPRRPRCTAPRPSTSMDVATWDPTTPRPWLWRWLILLRKLIPIRTRRPPTTEPVAVAVR